MCDPLRENLLFVKKKISKNELPLPKRKLSRATICGTLFVQREMRR